MNSNSEVLVDSRFEKPSDNIDTEMAVDSGASNELDFDMEEEAEIREIRQLWEEHESEHTQKRKALFLRASRSWVRSRDKLQRVRQEHQTEINHIKAKYDSEVKVRFYV